MPGGYTVEWFFADFYMWLLFDFWCFRDFRHLGWILGIGAGAAVLVLELEGRDRVEAAVLVLELEGRC